MNFISQLHFLDRTGPIQIVSPFVLASFTFQRFCLIFLIVRLIGIGFLWSLLLSFLPFHFDNLQSLSLVGGMNAQSPAFDLADFSLPVFSCESFSLLLTPGLISSFL